MADNRQSHMSDGKDDDDGKPSNSSQMNEQQIRELELDAYDSLLRAFSAQSDGITSSKRVLISDVGKVLRVTDEEHREMMGDVSHGETLSRGIRQSRSTGEKNPTSLPISLRRSRGKEKASDDAAMRPPPRVPVSNSAEQALPSPSPEREQSSATRKARAQIITAECFDRSRGASVGTPGLASCSGTLVGTLGPASGSGRNLRRALRRQARAEDEFGRQTLMNQYFPAANSTAALKESVDEIEQADDVGKRERDRMTELCEEVIRKGLEILRRQNADEDDSIEE